MGVAKRTTKIHINLDNRSVNGANTAKRVYLDLTKEILNQARSFYIDFFLAHSFKFDEIITYYLDKHKEYRERKINADELLTWAESVTMPTESHPHVLDGWNFTKRFPDLPRDYRRSVIKDAIGKAKSHLSNFKNWESSGKKKGKPGLPGSNNHPTLYKGSIKLELDKLDRRDGFVAIKVYNGSQWEWVNYPVKFSLWQERRLTDGGWENKSPKLVLRSHTIGLHVTQEKPVEAKKIKDSKEDPDLVTVGVDLNVKNLAVITVRWHGTIIETLFVTDDGLDQHRYRHMKVISTHQWQSGKPVKGEHSDVHLWAHIQRTNDDFAHKASRAIVTVCEKYPGCVLVFERLRKITPKKGQSKSRRMNRKKANQIRGKVFEYSKYKAYILGIVTVEVNPHGTSQFCSRCGHKGERFSYVSGKRVQCKWGKLFYCPHCGYTVNADFNASVNMHHSFYNEFHWQFKKKPSNEAVTTPCPATSRVG
ncbi:MAG TPA: transposase [Spirochaetia bacterium]|nr:transposase [Spirochaetia bacterium]